jgi:hypothetical protein
MTKEYKKLEMGWYWTKQRGVTVPMMAYCHGSSWNGLLGAIEYEKIEAVLSPRIIPPPMPSDLMCE